MESGDNPPFPLNIYGEWQANESTTEQVFYANLRLVDQSHPPGYAVLSEDNGDLILDNTHAYQSNTKTSNIILKTPGNITLNTSDGTIESDWSFDSCIHFPDGTIQCTATVPEIQLNYMTPGTYHYTIPDGINTLWMRLIGGGGGGGGGAASNRLTDKDGLYGGAGGGGGGYSDFTKSFTAGSANVLEIIVGQNGIGGHCAVSNGANYSDYDRIGSKGGNGGDTIIKLNGETLLQAGGGKGGNCGYYTGDVFGTSNPTPGVGGYGNHSVGATGGAVGQFNPNNSKSNFTISYPPLPPTQGCTSSGFGGGGGGASPMVCDAYNQYDHIGGSLGGGVPLALGLVPNVQAAGGGSGLNAIATGESSLQQIQFTANGGGGGGGLQTGYNFDGTVISIPDNGDLFLGGSALCLGGGGGGGGVWNPEIHSSDVYFYHTNLPTIAPNYGYGGTGGSGAAFLLLSKR